MAAPRVSIVMPCYQQRDFVREAVDSVLSQREVDVELLVMDPGDQRQFGAFRSVFLLWQWQQ